MKQSQPSNQSSNIIQPLCVTYSKEMNDSNDSEKLIDELTNLLIETSESHHKAFSSTEGEDPDWPIQYADYLIENMRPMLKAKFTKSDLIYLLVLADKEK